MHFHDRDHDDPRDEGFIGRDILGHSPACGPEACCCPMGLSRPARGFDNIRYFWSTLSVRAIPSLLALLPCLTRLSLHLLAENANGVGGSGGAVNNAAGASITRALEMLAKFSRLQSLYLICRHDLAPADIRLLHNLKELQSLEIRNYGENDATDDDVAALLHALPHLHTLSYLGEMRRLSNNALCVIGSAGPLLRSIDMTCHLKLPPTIVQQTPLFPAVEFLKLHIPDSIHTVDR
jgi:hypothetical protein